MSEYALQPFRITSGDKIVFEEGSSPLDLAKGYYDPDSQEVVVTLSGWVETDPELGRYVQRIAARLINGAWPTADVRSERESAASPPPST
jgi:hypothetical protein